MICKAPGCLNPFLRRDDAHLQARARRITRPSTQMKLVCQNLDFSACSLIARAHFVPSNYWCNISKHSITSVRRLMTLSLCPVSSTGWGRATSATRLQRSTLTAVSARMGRGTVLVSVHQLDKLDLVVFPSIVAVPALPTSGSHHPRGQHPTHPLLRAQPPPLRPQRPSRYLLKVLIFMLPPAVLLTTCHSVLGPCSVTLLGHSFLESSLQQLPPSRRPQVRCFVFRTILCRIAKRRAGGIVGFELAARGFKQVSLSSLLRRLLHAPARVHLTRTRLELKLHSLIW